MKAEIIVSAISTIFAVLLLVVAFTSDSNSTTYASVIVSVAFGFIAVASIDAAINELKNK